MSTTKIRLFSRNTATAVETSSRIALIIVWATALAVCASAVAHAQQDKIGATATEFAANKQVLVHYVEGRSDQARQVAENNGLTFITDNVPGRFLVFERNREALATAVALETAISACAESEAVEVIEPNFIVSIPRPITPVPEAARERALAGRAAAQANPDDPRVPELWGVVNSRAVDAWASGHTTSPIVVAVIDTGVDYNHEDLSGNIWTNSGEIPNNNHDDDGNGFDDDIHGFDFVNNDGDPDDDNLHGTHCAGTIGAVGNNSAGVVGVTWKVQIMAVKFLDENGFGNLNNAVRAIDYARENGAKVMNNSWGFLTDQPPSVALREAIERARDAGVLFIAAAGNESNNNDGSRKAYPASYETENVIAVAAIDEEERRASFSNFGATSVDLGAPGVDILSTFPNDAYRFLDGTSMATPHVAGAAALVLGHPAHASKSWDQIKALLLDNARPIPALSGITVTDGTLDLSFLGPDTLPPPTIAYTGENPDASGAFVLEGKVGRASYCFEEIFYQTNLEFIGEGESPEGLRGWIFKEDFLFGPFEFLFTEAAATPAPYHRIYYRASDDSNAPFLWLMDAMTCQVFDESAPAGQGVRQRQGIASAETVQVESKSEAYEENDRK